MSTKETHRDETDRLLASDVLTLPLFQGYTFQPMSANVGHATVVAEFAFPVWSVAGLSAEPL